MLKHTTQHNLTKFSTTINLLKYSNSAAQNFPQFQTHSLPMCCFASDKIFHYQRIPRLRAIVFDYNLNPATNTIENETTERRSPFLTHRTPNLKTMLVGRTAATIS